jgi:Leucine Rich repeats (2 copies)
MKTPALGFFTGVLLTWALLQPCGCASTDKNPSAGGQILGQAVVDTPWRQFESVSEPKMENQGVVFCGNPYPVETKEIVCSGLEISSLVGLENLTQLSVLRIENTNPHRVFRHAITDLSPLSKLSSLSEISLPDTRIETLAPLAGLANLKVLNLSNAPVKDLAPVASLHQIETLILSGSQIRDIEALRGLKNLKYLEISRTQVADLSPLADLQALEYVGLDGCPVTSLQPLQKKIAAPGNQLFGIQGHFIGSCSRFGGHQDGKTARPQQFAPRFSGRNRKSG